MADLLKAVIGAEFTGANAFNQANQAVSKTEQSLKKLVPGADRANQSMVNLSRVVQDAPYGFIGIANNIDPLLQSFTALKASTGSTGGALKALGSSLLGGGGLALGVSLVTSALVVFGDKLWGTSKKAKESADELERVKKVISEVSRTSGEVRITASGNVEEEIAKVNVLSKVVQDQTKSYKERNNALEQLKSINKNYFGDLTLESNSLATLTSRVEDYKNALISAAVVKEFSSDIAKTAVEISKASNKYNELSNEVETIGKKLRATTKFQTESISAGSGNTVRVQTQTKEYTNLALQLDKANEALANQGDLLAQLDTVSSASRSGLAKAIEATLKLKPLSVSGTKVSADKLDFEAQFASVKMLGKPIEIEGALLSFKNAEFGTDLLKKAEYEFSDRLKSMEKLVIKPDIKLSPDVKSLEDIKKELTSLQQGFTQLGQAIASVVTPALDEMVNNIGKGMNAFQAFGQMIVSIFKNVVTKLIQTAILSAIISAISGGVGNVAKGGLSFIQAFKGAFGGFKALGGPVGAGRSYIVGERGPELFTPGVSGNIIPNGRLGSVGSSFGGMQVSGYLTGRGNDLVAVIAAAGRSNRRLG